MHPVATSPSGNLGTDLPGESPVLAVGKKANKKQPKPIRLTKVPKFMTNLAELCATWLVIDVQK